MNGKDVHERARLLLDERVLGIIGDADAEWLTTHVAECEQCESAEHEMKSAIAFLRSEPVIAPTFLVSRTKVNVRIRARELQDEAERMRMVWLSVALAVIVSSATLYAGFVLYTEGWTALSGITAVLSAFALVWFWVAPAVLLLAATIYGKGELLRLSQESISGRGLGND